MVYKVIKSVFRKANINFGSLLSVIIAFSMLVVGSGLGVTTAAQESETTGNKNIFQSVKDKLTRQVDFTPSEPELAVKDVDDEILNQIYEETKIPESSTDKDLEISIEGVLLIEYDNESYMDDVEEVVADELDEDKSKIEDRTVKLKDQTAIINIESNQKIDEVISKVSKVDGVKNVQKIYNYRPMYAPTNDPEWASQWSAQNQIAGLNVEQGWDVQGVVKGVTCGQTTAGKNCAGDPSVKIAIIDTGVNTGVSDFAGANIDTANAMRFYNNPDNTCAAGTYYVGFQNSTPPPAVLNFCQDLGSQFDELGHGTGVASTIFAQDNTVGAVGIAHNTTLLPIAVHGEAFNTYFIAEAITYAVSKGAKVINLSLGSPFYDSYLESAVNNAVNQGAIVVAASGNCAIFSANCDWDGNGVQTSGFAAEANNALMYPAAFGNVIAVGASNYAGTQGAITRSNYSNFGNHVAAVAPVGDSSTSPSGIKVACGVVRSGCAGVNDYKLSYGTSYASPQIAGLAGLLRSGDSTLTTAKFRSLLQAGSLDLTSTVGKDDQTGYGLPKANTMIQNNSINIAFTSPLADSVISKNDPVNIVVAATSAAGAVASVKIYNDTTSTLLTTDTTAPYTYTIPANSTVAGQTNLRAVVTLADGTTKSTPIADIYIKDPRYIDIIPSQPSGDFNGNGRADVLWANDTAREVAYWDGGQQPLGGYLGPTSSDWEYLGKGDFDNNGKSDILWQNKNNSEVHFWLDGRQGRGKFLGAHPTVWKYIGVGDMDGNGRDDIVWWNQVNMEVGVWYDGLQRNGQIMAIQSYDWSPVGIGDMNNNGRDDVLWWHENVDEVGFWDGGRQNQGGYLGSQNKTWTAVSMGDYTGDGRADMAWVHNIPNSIGETDVVLWNGGLQSQQINAGTIDADEFINNVADINGDRRQDLILRKSPVTGVASAKSWFGGVESSQQFLSLQSGDWRML
jgi:subtilisin family serine protease